MRASRLVKGFQTRPYMDHLKELRNISPGEEKIWGIISGATRN